MEVCVPCNTPAGEYISKNSGLSDPLNQTHCNSTNPQVDYLNKSSPEHLKIEGDEISSGCYPAPDKSCEVSLEEGNVGRELDKSDSNTSSSTNKCLDKSATFPPSREPVLSTERLCGRRKKHNKRTAIAEANEAAKSLNRGPPRCNSLPAPSTLVSSLKGGREKQGIPPKKLSVSWAPDVYDPIPTSVSHVPNNNQHHRRDGKKNRKNKKKGAGKSDAGSGSGKEKKQPRRKKRGNNSKCNPPHDEVGPVDSGEAQSGFVDLNVASSDLPCGASFLKASISSSLHFPVAEAT